MVKWILSMIKDGQDDVIFFTKKITRDVNTWLSAAEICTSGCTWLCHRLVRNEGLYGQRITLKKHVVMVRGLFGDRKDRFYFEKNDHDKKKQNRIERLSLTTESMKLNKQWNVFHHKSSHAWFPSWIGAALQHAMLLKLLFKQLCALLSYVYIVYCAAVLQFIRIVRQPSQQDTQSSTFSILSQSRANFDDMYPLSLFS